MLELTPEEERQLLEMLEDEEYLSLLEDSISKEEWFNPIGI